MAYRLKFQPRIITFKTYIKHNEPLSSPIKQKTTPQKSDSYISLKFQLNTSTRW